MNATKRNSGNLGVQQDKKLGNLLRTNQVDFQNRNGNYLFEVTDKCFPVFIKAGKGGKNSAVQRLHGNFIRFEQDLLQQGARVSVLS